MTERTLTLARHLGFPEEEWAILRQHLVLAYEMLSPIRHLHPARSIPYCHHERGEGTGYPQGLSGEQIPLSARLFAGVDIWDAWPQERVCEHLCALRGTHLDPRGWTPSSRPSPRIPEIPSPDALDTIPL